MITSFLDVKQTVLSKSHYLLYGLAAAVQPRMLVTFDSELRPLPVSVRVGQAVDVVGQAGKPKTITGFQVGAVCGKRNGGFCDLVFVTRGRTYFLLRRF